MRNLLILPLLFVGLCLTAQGDQRIAFETGPWSETLRQAKEVDKPVFLFAYTESCGYCRQMEKEVFTDSTVAAYYNDNFLSYRIDIEDGGAGEALKDQYGITGYPTYLFFDADGELLHQSGSAKPADAFIQDAKDAGDPNKAVFSLKRRYDEGDRSPGLLYNYATVLTNYNQVDSPEETVAAEYLATQSPEQLASDNNLTLLFNEYLSFASPATQYFLEHHEAFVPLFGREEVEVKVRSTIRQCANVAGRMKDTEQLAEMKLTVARYFANRTSMPAVVDIYYYQGAADWHAYARSTLTYASGPGKQDTPTLLETAKYLRHFAEDLQTLETGVQIMKVVTETSRNFDNLLLRAQLEDLADLSGDALESAEEALQVAKETG
ncbi:MAG: thioredoxin family protein, partial [Lewinella sp.]